MNKFTVGKLVEQSGRKYVISQGYTPYESTGETPLEVKFQEEVQYLDGFQYGYDVRVVEGFEGTFKGTETNTGEEVTFIRGIVRGPRGGYSNTWFIMYPDRVHYGNPKVVR